MDTNQTIILSRVTIPRRRSDLVSRHRLTDLLNEVIDKRLVLVSAPAGYGKTSVFVDFAESGVRFSVGGYLVFQRMKPLVQPNGADEVTAIAEPSQHPLLLALFELCMTYSKK